MIKENVLRALDMMWKGMAAIFLVMLAIFLIVCVFNAVTAYRKKKREEREHTEKGLPNEKDIEQR